MLLHELLDQAIEIGIAGAKASCEPVSTALGYFLAVSDDLELTVLARREDGISAEAILEEGHETRDLGSVVLSRRAVNDLDLHDSLSNLLCVATWRLSRFVELRGCELRQQSHNFIRWLMNRPLHS